MPKPTSTQPCDPQSSYDPRSSYYTQSSEDLIFVLGDQLTPEIAIQREEAEHQARLDAIRADLDLRARTLSLSIDEMDEQLAAWRAKRGTTDDIQHP